MHHGFKRTRTPSASRSQNMSCRRPRASNGASTSSRCSPEAWRLAPPLGGRNALRPTPRKTPRRGGTARRASLPLHCDKSGRRRVSLRRRGGRQRPLGSGCTATQRTAQSTGPRPGGAEAMPMPHQPSGSDPNFAPDKHKRQRCRPSIAGRTCTTKSARKATSRQARTESGIRLEPQPNPTEHRQRPPIAAKTPSRK